MQDERIIGVDEDIPSFEPWVLTLLSVFIPIALGFIVPSLMWICFGAAGVLFIVAMVMFVRHERTRDAHSSTSV